MGTYRCPLDKTNTPGYNARANKLSSYIHNGATCGYGAAPNYGTYRQSEFRQDAFMMWEPYEDPARPLGWGYNDASSYPDPTVDAGIGKRHGKQGGIVLGYGGHVEYIKYATWEREARDPNKNRLWCNPGSVNGH